MMQKSGLVCPAIPRRLPPFARLSFSCVRRDKALDLFQTVKTIMRVCWTTMAVCVGLCFDSFFGFVPAAFLLVQFRGEDFGTSGQHHQTSAGRDRSQDLSAGQRIHERQVQGNICTRQHLVLRTCQKNT